MTWPPRRILVGTDFSEGADAALSAAAGLARRVGASLELVHALPQAAPLILGQALDDRLAHMPEVTRARDRARAKLESLASTIDPAPKLHLVPGAPAAEILALRELLRVDLVALGAGHMTGLRHFLFGSAADRVLRRPGCPLLLVNERPPAGEFKKILVALETPTDSRPWLEHALRLAHDERSEVVVLHVQPPRGFVSDPHYVHTDPERAPETLGALLGRLAPTVPAQIDVRSGDAAHEIVSAAREHGAHLVVLGAERNRDGWPGRVADRVARAGLPALLFVWPDRESSEEFDDE